MQGNTSGGGAARGDTVQSDIAADSANSPAHVSRLAHFPVSFFAVVMGLCGLSLAWHLTEIAYGWNTTASTIICYAAAAVFAVVALIYVLKLLRHPGAVMAELKHPVKLHFFPAVSISGLLLSALAQQQGLAGAHALFVISAAAHLAFMLYVLHVWFNHEHLQMAHLNPAWFIPAVGNVLVPIAGVGLGYIELSWFFFAIGILFWIVLFTIFVNRVLFHAPLPAQLAPTLFILIAPPAVGFVSYVKLTGGLDSFARVLFYGGLFLTLFLLTQVPRLARLPYFLSWWAYSFPLAAMTVACWVMTDQLASSGQLSVAATDFNLMRMIATAMIVLTSATITMLVLRTLAAIMRREICKPE